jgi:hypothetical protein
MASLLTSELLTGFVIKQLGSLFTSTLHRTVTPSSADEEEKELDRLQVERLLKWMELVFDDNESSAFSETHAAYHQELNSIYRTIRSDYTQYKRWKAYNQSIWLFSSYRMYDTKGLAKKLLSDIRLFKEGLSLWMMVRE